MESSATSGRRAQRRDHARDERSDHGEAHREEHSVRVDPRVDMDRERRPRYEGAEHAGGPARQDEPRQAAGRRKDQVLHEQLADDLPASARERNIQNVGGAG